MKLRDRIRNKLSIKWKMFATLFAFTLFVLALLWYFQIVHLENFYKYIKKRELMNTAITLEKNLSQSDLSSYLGDMAKEHDLGISIVDNDGRSLYSANISEISHIYIMTRNQFDEIKENVKKGNGVATYEVDGIDRGFKEKARSGFSEIDNPPHPEDKPDKPGFLEQVSEPKSMVYVKAISFEGKECYLMVSSLITPVDATVNTLRIQFIYLTIIVLVLSVLHALVISSVVSKPLVKINDSAKHLAQGDFGIHFEGDGYREVVELSKTLNYAADELGKAESLQRDLVANVSHDLRTPLTMITAYAEVMRDIPGENNPENVQIIIDEATRLTTLVNDLLVLSKLQAGVTELEKEYFDFTSSIKAVLKRFRKLTEQDGYNISFEYNHNVLIYADEYKIYQVVYNLINNAINYSGEDKAVIVRQIVHGDILRLEVEDHGAGIAEDELQNIWDRYYKIDKNHKRAVQGTGLGLSIVQNILKLHDAKFGVNSRLGAGSVFWFELKVAREDAQI